MTGDYTYAVIGPRNTNGGAARIAPALAFRSVTSAAPTADTAVFVHGLDSWSQDWAELIQELRTSLHCVAVDLPGFGHSEPPRNGDVSLHAQTQALIAHLEATTRVPVHLVGNSLGGLICIGIAAQRPDLAKTLTLISPFLPALPPTPAALQVALLALPGAARLHARLQTRYSAAQQVDDLYALIYADLTRPSPERRALEEQERARRAALPYATEMLTGALRATIRTYMQRGTASPWYLARLISAPTLLVYGRKDRLVPFRSAYRTYGSLGDARLLVLPEAGHVAMTEQPRLVARAIREMLQ